MKEQISRRQLIVGLPESGKSTFIGALAYVADSPEVNSAMSLVKLSADDERVNTLIEKWLQCEAPERTQQAGEQTIVLHLETSADDDGLRQSCELLLPDLAGETFERQWTDRQCTKAYFDLVGEVEQVLVFVNPEKVEEPTRIEELLRIDDVVEEVEGRPSLPTQVVLVDLLQCLLSSPFRPRNLRVAIVISAWDVVEILQNSPGEPKLSPLEWLEKHLPLLHQYSLANASQLCFRVWGVSAQGGSYDDDVLVQSLRAESAPEKRVRLVSKSEVSHDLTEIVEWLLRADSPCEEVEP